MLYGGAKEETAAQIARVFRFGEAPLALMSAWGRLVRALEDPQRPITLRLANRLFGERTYRFEQPYLDAARNALGAGLEPMDFRTAVEPARRQINAWVAERTEHRIEDMLPSASLDMLTRLVLVNAIYFRGRWSMPFDQANTRPEPFFISPVAKRDVSMMRKTDYFAAAQVGGVKLLELPYKGASVSFLAVLPEQADGLDALEASLSCELLKTWRDALEPQEVVVRFPCFALNPSVPLSLAPVLATLGAPAPFSPAADFTAIADPADAEDRLYISEALHKTVITVDESGAEAAAATAMIAMAGAAPPTREPFEFRADHPFLFFVIDAASGLIVFMGRVVEP
jgi:serpin B